MDLTEKIRAAFTRLLGSAPPVVVKVKAVGDRVLVYVVSRAFVRQSPLKRQRLVSKALRGTDSSLSPTEQHRIGLVRTFTPGEAGKIIQYRRASRARPAPGPVSDKVSGG
jgi:acid stress-induced BolA-like protein IbaG/YrbA